MAVVAKEFIKTNSGVHAPGAVIEGLSATEEKRLVDLGAVELAYTSPTTTDDATDDDVDTQELIKAALMTMTKDELTSYAASVDVVVDPKATKSVMVDELAGHELFLDTLSTPALQVLAGGEGVTEEMTRGELLALLTEG